MDDQPLDDPSSAPDYCGKDCPPQKQYGCTLTQGYWKNHESWPLGYLDIGEWYWKWTLLEWMWLDIEGDASLILLHQYIAAELNIAAGADPSDIEDTLDAALDWLDDYASLPAGVSPSSPDGSEAVELADELERFNSGVMGPGHCLVPPEFVPVEPVIVL